MGSNVDRNNLDSLRPFNYGLSTARTCSNSVTCEYYSQRLHQESPERTYCACNVENGS